MGKFTASLSKELAQPLLYTQLIHRGVCQQSRLNHRDNWPLRVSKPFLVQVFIDWSQGNSNDMQTAKSAWGPHCTPSVQLDQRAPFLIERPSTVQELLLTNATTATVCIIVFHTVCTSHAATSMLRDYFRYSAFQCRDRAFHWWRSFTGPLITSSQHANARSGLTRIALLLELHSYSTVRSEQGEVSKHWSYQRGYRVRTALRKPIWFRICFAQAKSDPQGP